MRIKERTWVAPPWLVIMVVVAATTVACTLGVPVRDGSGVSETNVAAAVDATLTAIAGLQTATAPHPSEAATSTGIPQATTATETAVPSATLTGTPRPIPTAAVPTSTTFPGSSYELAEEHIIGDYAIRIWTNTFSPSDGPGFDRIVTLAQSGSEPIAIEFFSRLNELTGTDITGDGIVEVVIETYTGGAHCCFATQVYSLGPTPTKIMDTRPSNCGGQFRDLNGDGGLEFVTCDDIFAYVYCPYAASPLVTAVLTYESPTGYAPANAAFGEIYAAELDRLRAQAEAGAPGELGEWDGSSKCSVLPYTLALLYSGQAETAWAELARIYPFDDRLTFQAEIEETAGSSQLFAGP